ncbi:hypothetical protein IWQ57_003928, partial [Coemansia nantahalensis]
MTQSGSAAGGWTLGPTGGSWHMWTYNATLDRADLPPWPATMAEARVVLSSEMCRTAGARPIPLAPFMPPDGLEHCGAHTSATARPDVLPGAPMAAARAEMRRWLAAFAGWADVDGAIFSDLGAASIYRFRAHTAASIGLRSGRGLDLSGLAGRDCAGLAGLPAPAVARQGAPWLDNYRLEVQLRRAAHGPVGVRMQLLSLLRPAAEIAVQPLASASSRLTWIGPDRDANAFTLVAGQPKPEALAVPAGFYARDPGRWAGEITGRTERFSSFHPELAVTASVHPRTGHPEGCQLAALVALPRTYFFDPYQLRQLHDEGRLGAGSYSHHGPVELERPAESLGNWGSVLALTRPLRAEQLSLTLPIHARYRLLP